MREYARHARFALFGLAIACRPLAVPISYAGVLNMIFVRIFLFYYIFCN